MRVGILGAGRWGQALARLVMAAGHEPFIAYKDTRKPPQILKSSNDPPKVSAACELLICATSASEVRRAIQLAKPTARHRVVVAGRGMDPETSQWLTDVVLEESAVLRVGALAGPAPVDEILNGGLCAGVVASRFHEVCEMTTTALHSQRYRMYESSDLVGVQLAGAMVPALATLMGVAHGLRGSGVGLRAMVLSRGLEEAGRLARAMDSDPLTFTGLAGVGDLVAAQAIGGHPNFDAGLALAKGDTSSGPEMLTKAVVRLARKRGVELPLTEALCWLYDGGDALGAVSQLMARPAQVEHR